MAADPESHADLARVLNARLLVREANDAGEARLIFDGAGVKWIGELAKEDHRSHKLYQSIQRHIAGACTFCAVAFSATEAVETAGVRLLDEHHQHPSLRSLVATECDVLIF